MKLEGHVVRMAEMRI